MTTTTYKIGTNLNLESAILMGIVNTSIETGLRAGSVSDLLVAAVAAAITDSSVRPVIVEELQRTETVQNAAVGS